jgi:hypothetical protein
MKITKSCARGNKSGDEHHAQILPVRLDVLVGTLDRLIGPHEWPPVATAFECLARRMSVSGTEEVWVWCGNFHCQPFLTG